MKTFKQFLKEAKQLKEEKLKYKKGEFGYWWTIELGNEDIEGKVYGRYINCIDRNLTSLRGCPKEVKGYFDCSFNYLTTLEYAPEKVGRYFDCSDNQLTSLKGCPEKIGAVFNCSDNQLTSLKGGPKETGHFLCTDNKLKNFKGAPEIVRGNIFTENNLFTSLDGLPKSIFGNLNISNFDSLGGIDKIKELDIHIHGYIYSDGKKIKYDWD